MGDCADLYDAADECAAAGKVEGSLLCAVPRPRGRHQEQLADTNDGSELHDHALPCRRDVPGPQRQGLLARACHASPRRPQARRVLAHEETRTARPAKISNGLNGDLCPNERTPYDQSPRLPFFSTLFPCCHTSSYLATKPSHQGRCNSFPLL